MPAATNKVAHLISLVSFLLVFFVNAAVASQFKTAPAYPVQAQPRFVVVGDFNGDGIADLAVVNSTGTSGPSVTFLAGNSDGTFVTPGVAVPLTGISNPQFAVSLNCNGLLDLAVASPTSNKIVVLVNQGGLFVFNLTTISDGSNMAPTSPSALAAGDLNGDGKIDLVVANVQGGTNNGGSVGVLLGSGNCSFPTIATYAAGTNPDAIALGNFTSGSKPDIAVANFTSNSLTVLPNDGSGGFGGTPKTTLLPLGDKHPVALVAADFDGNGRPDLVVANLISNIVTSAPSGNVRFMPGNGDGTFGTSGASLTAGLYPQSVVAADFNGDGLVDIAVANADGSSISTFLNNNSVMSGSFKAAVNFAAGTLATGIAEGSFGSSGPTGLAVANANDNTVSVLLGIGDGTFWGARTYGVGTTPVSVAAASFRAVSPNPIGLAIANSAGGTNGNGNISSFVQNGAGSGDGTFKSANPSTHVADKNPASVQIAADFDGDGLADLAVANQVSGDVSILTGNGFGAYHSTVTKIAVGSSPSSVAIADFNGDLRMDIAVANFGSNTITVLLNNGGLIFQATNYTTTCPGPIFVAAVDVDGDGFPDLVAVNSNPSSPTTPPTLTTYNPGCVSVWLNNRVGGFNSASNYTVGAAPVWAAVGFFNNDNFIDLAVANYNDGNISVLLGASGGVFGNPVQYKTCANPVAVGVLDYDGDGALDLVTLGQANNFMAVLLGKKDNMGHPNGTFTGFTSCTTLSPPNLFNVGDTPSSLVIKDLDANSKLDLVLTSQGGNNITVLLGN